MYIYIYIFKCIIYIYIYMYIAFIFYLTFLVYSLANSINFDIWFSFTSLTLLIIYFFD